jgi:hypothetical protein
MTGPSVDRLLTKLFFRRFLESDRLSPSGDAHESLTFGLAGLVVSGLWVSAGLVLKATSPFVSPFGSLLSALNDKFVGLAGAMIVTGLAAVIEWDALNVDGRDFAILAPLPIRSSAIFRAKLRALGWLVAAFALAMNALPALTYPPLQSDALRLGLLSTLWLVAAHIVTSLAACSFGLLSVLVLREGVQLMPRRLIPVVSAGMQFVGVIVLTTALLLVVAVRAQVPGALDHGDGRLAGTPPMWFVGLYETIVAPVIRPVEAQSPRHKRQYWTHAQDQRNRSQYLSYSPALGRLGGHALASLGLLTLSYAGLFAFNRRRLVQSMRWGRPLAGRISGLVRFLEGGVVRDPVAQAGFFFTLQTLARSAVHRAYLAGYLGAGVAVSVVMIAVMGRGTGVGEAVAPPAQLMAVQMVLSFFLVFGLRRVFATPSELRANWIFRLSWDNDADRYLCGVRRAVKLGLLLPFFVVLGALQASLWGPQVAAAHFLVGWLASTCLADAVLLNFFKLPFTCSYSPKGTLKTRWSLYAVALYAYSVGFTSLERRALESARGVTALVVGLVALATALGAYRRLRSRRDAVLFDDPPEEPTQRLGLMSRD